MMELNKSNWIFCFISICKFGSFKNPFATITSLSEFYFWIRRFILLVKWKKWFLWTMAAAQAAENHGDEWGLTWYFLWGIYTSIPTWTHSQNSLAVAEALRSLKKSSHETSLKWSQRPKHKDSHIQCDETRHPTVNLMESQWKVRQQNDQNF